MKIIAILAVRNEELYLDRCLRHLHEQGVRAYIMDNESTDRTVQIARAWQDRCVIGIETFRFQGSFDLAAQMQRKEQLHRELKADWYIHHDADEIRCAPPPHGTLAQGIAAMDAAGYNAIDFHEFVFVPTSPQDRFEDTDYVEAMRWYYYFHRAPRTRVNAWKNLGQDIDLTSSGGHQVNFEGLKLAPQMFIMRHYIVLSLEHAIGKYCRRVFNEQEIKQRGWHRSRVNMQPQDITLPRHEELFHAADGQMALDLSRPRSQHLLFAGKTKPAADTQPRHH